MTTPEAERERLVELGRAEFRAEVAGMAERFAAVGEMTPRLAGEFRARFGPAPEPDPDLVAALYRPRAPRRVEVFSSEDEAWGAAEAGDFLEVRMDGSAALIRRAES